MSNQNNNYLLEDFTYDDTYGNNCDGNRKILDKNNTRFCVRCCRCCCFMFCGFCFYKEWFDL